MDKVIFNPLKKWRYSRICRTANQMCDEQPSDSEAHFIAFYTLMLSAQDCGLAKESFQTLLYTINTDTTLNYSVFGVFKARDNYAREQVSLRLSNYYSKHLSAKKLPGEHMRVRNEIAQEYADALGCKFTFVDVGELKDTPIMAKFLTLDPSSKAILAITMQENLGSPNSKVIRFQNNLDNKDR